MNDKSIKQQNRIIRLSEVRLRCSLSRSTIYEMMQSKKFPQRVKLGERGVGWVEAEIDEWINNRAKIICK